MDKILIRPLHQNDADVSFRWRNVADVWEYTGNRPHTIITKEIEEKWILSKLEETQSKRFAIEVNDVYIGNVQLTGITLNEAELHIFIGVKSYWGKGVGFLAIQQIIRFARNDLKLEKIYLTVNPENQRAVKLYERVGFVKSFPLGRMELKIDECVLPKISICCLVYNHGRYLKDCLDGFLMQKCKFDFEIVIGEDSSTDNSREILLDYHSRYPGKFKLLLHDENVGAELNQHIVIDNCSGDYIALCEGDDYWIDPLKLQKQFDIMENDKQLSICFSDVYELVNGEMKSNSLIYSKSEYSIIELSKGNFIHTPSVLFRSNFLDKGDFRSIKSYVGDYILLMLLARRGGIFYLNEITAVYRYHAAGSWSEKNMAFQMEKIKLYLFELLKVDFSRKVKRILFNRLFFICLSINDKEKKRLNFLSLFRINPMYLTHISFKYFLRNFLVGN